MTDAMPAVDPDVFNRPAESVFETPEVWSRRWRFTLLAETVVGGVPGDPDVMTSWLKSKFAANDERVHELVVATIAARKGIDVAEITQADIDAMEPDDLDSAIESTAAGKVDGFLRDETGLYIAGRQVKAMLKEAVSIAVAAGRLQLTSWGITRKFLHGFTAEHVMVLESRFYLVGPDGPIQEPTEVMQRFVHSRYGSAIALNEVCRDVAMSGTIVADTDEIDDKFWQQVWPTAELQGIGACRSQGFGRFKVVKWEADHSQRSFEPIRKAPPKEVSKTRPCKDCGTEIDKPAMKCDACKGKKAA